VKSSVSFIERHGLWSDDQRREAQELERRIEKENLHLVRLAWADPAKGEIDHTKLPDTELAGIARGREALAVFGVVYGLIYLLMRLEDFALLAGSIASFLGLAGAMYLTRNLDWYGGKAAPKPNAAAGA